MSSKKQDSHILHIIFTLAWPTMLEHLMQTTVQYIDTAMVGTLGTQATAAVGSTTTLNWLVSGTIAALGVGFLSYIARALGAGDKKYAAKVSAQAVLAVLVSGIFFTIACLTLSKQIPVWMRVDPTIRSLSSTYFFILYAPMLPRDATIIFGTVLRAAGDTKTPMRVGIGVNIVNVVLNFILIFPTRALAMGTLSFTMPGANLGVIGAAIASAIAFTVGGIYISIAYWKHPLVSPKGLRIRPDKEILKPCLKIAIPNMFQRFATSLGYVAFASMINSVGEVSTAAHTIANTVESAFYIPGYGMQAAAATLTGNALGAKDEQKMKDYTRTILLLEVFLMVLSGTLLFIFAPNMMSLFTKDTAVISLGSTVLRMVAVTEPFFGVSVIMEGIMQGVGKTVTPFIFNIIGMWFVRIVGTFICTQFLGFGLIAAWACMIAHNILLFTLFCIYYRSGRWNPLKN